MFVASINARDINYQRQRFGELAAMEAEKQLDNFISLLKEMYSTFTKDMRAKEVMTGSVEDDCQIENRRGCMMSRLKALGNPKVEPIAEVIVKAKGRNYAYIMKQEICHSIMGYETKLRDVLLNWSEKDFEDMYNVLYGQESENG